MNENILGLLLLINIAMLVYLVIRKSGGISKETVDKITNIDTHTSRFETILKDEIGRNRLETSRSDQETREELSLSIKSFGDSLTKNIQQFSTAQNKNFDQFRESLLNLTDTNSKNLQTVRETIEKRLDLIQKNNTIQLEKMRDTVDEKLTETLDKRLGEKFKLVNDRLEQVYKGLGEMKVLASNVGDLKNVLANVKIRGTWGEIQLEALLEQILIPEQYDKNVITKTGSNDRVEFAIKIPSKGDKNKFIYLPIDVKFPIEDYQRLINAQEEVNKEQIQKAQKAIAKNIKTSAAYIQSKYIDPPNTTDFGILYLPIEGLYSEVIQQRGLCESLQQDFRIVVMGPNTVAAFLNSLQMGFRTLAIEKRTSEIWNALDAFKKEFGQFEVVLSQAEKKIQEAGNKIGEISTRTRVINRKLTKVQELPDKKKTKTVKKLEIF